MTITLSQSEYWELWQNTENAQAAISKTYQLPVQLGQGLWQEYNLRDGLNLGIENICLKENICVKQGPREHPIEYIFEQVCCRGKTEYRYTLCGSGLAPKEIYTRYRETTITGINVHIDPALFKAWFGVEDNYLPCFDQLLRSPDTKYYEVTRPQNAAMQMTVQQILQCPFTGVTRCLYFESKMWELMVLILEDLSQEKTAIPLFACGLKEDDIERIHYGGKILREHLQNPPSLIELARAVGINDHKLKIGFRQVFKTTVFGYLHDQRLERSRQLLAAGEMTVAEAAAAVGFANRGHFAAAFRRKFGINPGLYARQKRS